MSIFSEIEKTIERGFHRFAERMFGPADSSELLLLHRAILADVESKVQVVARGRRLFPFARVVVTLVSAEAGRRDILQAAFGERLAEDIREAMQGSSRCVRRRPACAISRSPIRWKPSNRRPLRSPPQDA
jgi:hypothetical protein